MGALIRKMQGAIEKPYTLFLRFLSGFARVP
jgi:hypothetical protein